MNPKYFIRLKKPYFWRSGTPEKRIIFWQTEVLLSFFNILLQSLQTAVVSEILKYLSYLDFIIYALKVVLYTLFWKNCHFMSSSIYRIFSEKILSENSKNFFSHFGPKTRKKALKKCLTNFFLEGLVKHPKMQ